jgi:diguanylate cyclase (GGDEF)-like protein
MTFQGRRRSSLDAVATTNSGAGEVAPRSLLLVVVAAAVGLAALHLVVYLAFGSIANAIGAALILAYVALLAAGALVFDRGRPMLGMALAGGGLIAVSFVLAMFVPTTEGLVLIAPIVLVALAITHASRARLGRLAIASWAAGLGILLVIALTTHSGATPPPVVDAFMRIVQAATGLGVAIFLLWQSSSRLDAARDRMAAANRGLVEAQDTVKRVNRELRRQVHELELRNREASLVGHMGSLLEVSQTADEAYAVIERAARLLFPGLSGALLILPPNRLVVERVAAWGAIASDRRIYRPDDCWALRQGRLYVLDAPGNGPVCAHVSGDDPRPYLCIPLTAQGATLGIFHLSAGSADPSPDKAEPGFGARPTEGRPADGRLTESAKNLGLWVAELLALSLANFRLRETLHAQSTRDPLTGLFNRRYMEDSLERELYRAAREQGTLGVVMIDLDHFKAFNDRSGHVAGDAVLRSLADLLASSVRAEDIVCRYGGEEFTILLPNAGRDEVTARAESIREATTTLVVPDGHRLTISLGVSVYPDHGETAGALIGAADAALYEAKATGRDRVVSAA